VEYNRAEETQARPAKYRINVNLSEDSYQTLRDMARQSGQDMSELVRTGLRIYNTLLQERAQGKRVYIGTRDKVEKELLIP